MTTAWGLWDLAPLSSYRAGVLRAAIDALYIHAEPARTPRFLRRRPRTIVGLLGARA